MGWSTCPIYVFYSVFHKESIGVFNSYSIHVQLMVSSTVTTIHAGYRNSFAAISFSFSHEHRILIEVPTIENTRAKPNQSRDTTTTEHSKAKAAHHITSIIRYDNTDTLATMPLRTMKMMKRSNKTTSSPTHENAKKFAAFAVVDDSEHTAVTDLDGSLTSLQRLSPDAVQQQASTTANDSSIYYI